MCDEGIDVDVSKELCAENGSCESGYISDGAECELDDVGVDAEDGDDLDLSGEAFLAGYDLLKIPVIDNVGASVWVERFPLWKIEKLKKTVGMTKFSAQMMLEPVNLERGRFDVSRLKFYDAELERCQRNGMFAYSIGGKPVVSYSCWWDPAFGSVGGDGSVISVIFVGADGQYYLHDLEYLHYTTGDGEKSAEEQCRAVVKFLARNFVGQVYVESNGIGKFLPEFLQMMLNKTGGKCQVVPRNSSMSKVLRITSAFDTLVSAGFLNVSEKVRKTPFMAEFEDWNVDTKGHDDGLDSVGSAIAAGKAKLPVRDYADGVFPIRRGLSGGLGRVKICGFDW